ncbi:MAG: response regulator transcription factor [Bacteroidetes bacterium]|nr:response regulator transcription factor [Bacteroidota bacterium]
MDQTRIIIIEDEPIIAEDLKVVLEDQGYFIGGTAHNSQDALEVLENTPADIVLLDIDLKSPIDGIALANIIRKKYGLPFIYLTSFADAQTIERVRTTRPYGYILKPFSEKELRACLEIALFNHAREKLPHGELNKQIVDKQLDAPLTSREFDILQLLYTGKSNKEIAEALFVSTNTVKTHLSNLYLKLDAHSKATAIARIRELMNG